MESETIETLKWALYPVFMTEVTHILTQMEQGERKAAEQLLPLVYSQLRELARAKLRHERPDHTLQATALVHEAYLRLVGQRSDDTPSWESRGHFFAAAAEAMRRILVESIRQKNSLKRGGGFERIEFDTIDVDAGPRDERILALDSALDRLDEVDPVKSKLVKLRMFPGLSNAEAAQALGISARTADRHWTYARAWLLSEMQKD